MAEVIDSQPSNQTLRKLNHAEWLSSFAVALAVPGRPMTPFRVGAMERLALAADYIRLLQKDIAKLKVEIADLQADITELKLDLDHANSLYAGR